MEISANATANRRYIEVVIEDEEALTVKVMLTPEEVNDLQAKLADALASRVS